MNNETNRLAQIIANAADKELAVRQDGQPRRQDKAAALAIEAEYLFIRRDEMPKAEIVDRNGVDHVDVKSDAGTWSTKHSSADYARTTGLEYLAASIALQEWRDNEAERACRKRKMDLWEQMGGLPGETDERLASGVKWGVSWRGVTAYESEEEARRNLDLAQMDVPAVLVVDDGNGWMVVPC